MIAIVYLPLMQLKLKTPLVESFRLEETYDQ